MQYFEKPEVYVLKGEEAIETLNNYIHELKEGTAQELTEEQTKAMIKLAEGLIQTIQNDTPTREKTKKATFLPKITETVKKLISGEPAHTFSLSPVNPQIDIHHPQSMKRQIR